MAVLQLYDILNIEKSKIEEWKNGKRLLLSEWHGVTVNEVKNNAEKCNNSGKYKMITERIYI